MRAIGEEQRDFYGNGLFWLNCDARYEKENMGYIPVFLHELDPRPAKEQIQENYAHGGGWRPQDNWENVPNTFFLRYKGENYVYKPLYMTRLHADDPNLPTETFLIYENAWCAIFEEDLVSFEVSRMD